MRSLIIIEVEHGETTDGIAEALFDFGIGEPDDAGTEWPNMKGQDYTVTNYTLKVDTENTPAKIVLPKHIFDAILSCADAAYNADGSMSQSLATEAESLREWLTTHCEF